MKPERQCNRCAVWKSINHFYITKWQPDGNHQRRGICDTCHCMDTRDYYHNLPPETKRRVNAHSYRRRRERGRNYQAEYRVRRAKHNIQPRKSYREILDQFKRTPEMATWSLNQLIRATGFTRKTIIKARREWAGLQEQG